MAFTRTIIDDTDARCTYQGSGWLTTTASALWGSWPTSPASSGTTHYNNTSGATMTLTLPANHGFTSGMLGGFTTGIGNTNSSISVDGVVQQSPWSQRNGTSSDSHHYVPRSMSNAFVLNPIKSSPQLVVITVGSDGSNMIFDFAELYTAAAPVAGRVTGTGHSMEYPVISSGVKGPAAYGHRAQFVAYLNAIKYLGITWTAVNQGVPSENLTEGSVLSGAAGGPNSAGAYPQFTNFPAYENTAILTPGWMRHEACDLWPNVGGHAPRLGAGLFTTDADYMAGVAQWAGSMFQMGIYWHGFNDAGLIYQLDDPPDDQVGNNVSGFKTIFTITAGSPAPTANYTLNDGTHSVVLNPLSDIPSMNSAAAAASFPYTFVSNSGHGTGVSALSIAGDVVTGTENVRASSTVTRTVNSNNGGVTVAITQAGVTKQAAGPGATVGKYKLRFRADLARPLMAITPPPLIFVLGHMNQDNGGPNTDLLAPGSGSSLGIHQQLDNAIQDVCNESWIEKICGGINPVIFVPLRGVTTGIRSNVSSIDPHPTLDGHNAITKAIIDAFEKKQAMNYRPSGVYNGGIVL